MTHALYYTIAAAYGQGTYNSSTYQSDGTTSTTTGTTTGTGSGLTNTGFDLIAAATFACLLIFVALLARFWKRGKKSAPSAE